MEASVVGGSAVLEEKSLVVGSWLDMFDTKTNKWYPARIVEEEQSRVHVQFHGWGDRYNQWVEKVSWWWPEFVCFMSWLFFVQQEI